MTYGNDPNAYGKSTHHAQAEPQPATEPRRTSIDERDVRNWAMAAHLCGLLILVNIPIPFAHVIGPLVIWLWKRRESPFIDQEAKESLNFNITVSIYYILCGALMLILIGYVLIVLVGIAHIILAILAGLSARDGKPYRYPATFRFIK